MIYGGRSVKPSMMSSSPSNDTVVIETVGGICIPVQDTMKDCGKLTFDELGYVISVTTVRGSINENKL